jgi:hypothetical protein
MPTPSEAAREALKGRTRLINDTDAEIARILQRAADEVAGILARQPTDYQSWYLPQLQQQIKAALARWGNQGSEAIDNGLTQAWRGGSLLVDGVLEAAAVRVVLPVIDDTVLRAMRSFLTEKIRGITLEAANAINTDLGLVMIGARTPFQAVQAVQATLNESTRRRATTIVHTELARAYSTANSKRLQQAAQHVPGMQKKWLKSGKVHPRQNHMLIHGQIRDIDKPFDLPNGVQLMHPHDPQAPASEVINCGCVAVPVLPGWKSMVRGPVDDNAGVPLASILGN